MLKGGSHFPTHGGTGGRGESPREWESATRPSTLWAPWGRSPTPTITRGYAGIECGSRTTSWGAELGRFCHWEANEFDTRDRRGGCHLTKHRHWVTIYDASVMTSILVYPAGAEVDNDCNHGLLAGQECKAFSALRDPTIILISLRWIPTTSDFILILHRVCKARAEMLGGQGKAGQFT